MRITVIGLGNMGQAFASRAHERGHHVTVWNRTPGRAVALIASGVREADSAAGAVNGADVVLVVLADDAAVLEVCLGHAGIMSALGPAAVLANISTVAPDTARRLAESGPEGRVLDAPVMGSPEIVAAGLGGFLIGGPLETVIALDAVWEDLGHGYTHCGAAGGGATMKLVSNLLLITGVAALAEGIATARGSGISDELIRGVLGESFVVSPAAKMRLESLMDADHPGWFAPSLARKDVRLAVALAGSAGVQARVGPATESLLSALIGTGREWPDFAAVIEALS